VRYINATGDERFEREAGLEILAETARLWAGLGHCDRHGEFHLDGVTGPDEYSALASDNVYTNLMAQRNLAAAADAVERHPAVARQLGAGEQEAKAWRAAAAAMHLPYDHDLGVHPQAEGFTPLRRIRFRLDQPRLLPAAAARPLLRPVPQAGRQAGRLGAGDALAGRRVHPGAKGPQLRLLRAADGP